MPSATSCFCGSNASAFRTHAGLGGRHQVAKGAAAAVMRKKDIHPEWFSEAKVFCNGVEVMTVGGTKPEYSVDIYSGNHPFYQGSTSNMVMDEGQLNKFKKRFAELEELSTVAVLTGELQGLPEKKPKAPVKGKKKR